MFPLAFVTGSLQGHWWGFISRNYVAWPIFFLMNVFIALKGTHFYHFLKIKLLVKTFCRQLWSCFIHKAIMHFHSFSFKTIKQVTNNTLMKINTCTKLVGHPFIDNDGNLFCSKFCYTKFWGGVRLIILITSKTRKTQYYPSKTWVFPVKPTGLGNTHKTRVFANLVTVGVLCPCMSLWVCDRVTVGVLCPYMSIWVCDRVTVGVLCPSMGLWVLGKAVFGKECRLLLKEQSDQGLHCLPFCLHLLDTLVQHHTVQICMYVQHFWCDN